MHWPLVRPFPNLTLPKVHLVRYANHLVMTAKDQQLCQLLQKEIEIFLAKRGLQLNQQKTGIKPVKKGFDFLGFSLKHELYNYKMNRVNNSNIRLIIRPSKANRSSFYKKIKKEALLRNVLRNEKSTD